MGEESLLSSALAWPSVLLVLGLVAVFYRKSKKPVKEEKLSEKEIQDLIDNFHPEPLGGTPFTDKERQEHYALNPKIVDGKMGHYVNIDGKQHLNMATLDFLGFTGDERIENVAKETIKKYGVGSCGPRGFYGTLDVHLELEKQLAVFMKCEEAVMYSYAFATITSAIPAYAKRGDVIFVDKGVHFAIQKAVAASRSRVVWFEHNDLEDLHKCLEKQAQWDAKNKSKADKMRRFCVVEGVYMNSGKMVDLPRLMELKWQYKVRIFIDESLSFGVLGTTGRGLTEHYDIDVQDVDMIMVSMETTLASTGGFCVGRSFVIEHQHLSGTGYCFSASLPPPLVTSAGAALGLIDADSSRVHRLQCNCSKVQTAVRDWCNNADASKQMFTISPTHTLFSPILHLYSTETEDESQEQKLDELVKHAFDNGIALTRARYLNKLEAFSVRPSIRISINSELTEKEIEHLMTVLTSFVKNNGATD